MTVLARSGRVALTISILIRAAIPGVVSAQTPDSGDAEDYRASVVVARLVVGDRETAGAELTDWAESVGGYFTNRSLDRVDLRLPDEGAADLAARLADLALEVLAYNPSTEDVRQQLSRVEAGITSREESLEEILRFLETADVPATLAFEQELSAILRELENLIGRRRLLLHRAEYTYVTVALSSKEEQIPTVIPSSFEWINSMGLYRFIREVGR